MNELQGLPIEDMENQIIPLERQSLVEQSAAAPNTTERDKQKYTKMGFEPRVKCSWCLKMDIIVTNEHEY